MTAAIKKVAVVGAGVMGAGIAAQVANAGVPVLLLDIVPPGGGSRNALAEKAVAAMLKADPAPFMGKRAARLVTPGNLEDDLVKLSECDWIIEVIVEKLEIKKALYKKLQEVRRPGSIVSSNTSTIPLRQLVEGSPKAFAADFLITHFFNPPRYMRLLETVAGPDTRPDAVQAVRAFADVALGKTVIACKDTPGFIGNRIGIFWIQSAITAAIESGIAVEDADAVLGKPMGIPKTGVFGLLDLVGIDLTPHVVASMVANLPKTDALHGVLRDPSLIQRMIAEGLTGRKGKGGFYRLDRTGGGKAKLAIDLKSGQYRPQRKAELESLDAFKSAGKTEGARTLLTHGDIGGRYAWKVMSGTLAYAAQLAPEIAETIEDVDAAMRLGYNWKNGPFELLDRLGAGWFADRLRAEGRPVPPLIQRAAAEGGFYRVEKGVLQTVAFAGGYRAVTRPEGVLLLEDIKRKSRRITGNGSASVWDIGDGVLCFEVHTKMNTIDRDVLTLLGQTIARVPLTHKALVIYNEGSNFSAGANLGIALFAANIALWNEIDGMVKLGQDTYKALRYARFPTVAAPSGLALGGGCEMLLHSSAIQAHAESYIGLVEVGVGVVPGWGGCKEMLRRWATGPKMPQGPMPAVGKCLETLGTATVAKSAAEAKELMFLAPGDGITMNRDRLLADAKARALAMVKGYRPPEAHSYVLPGPSGQAALALAVDGLRKSGKALPHDATVVAGLAVVLSGGDTDPTQTVSEDDILALERTEFMKLVRHPKTLARIESIIVTGRPLRN